MKHSRLTTLTIAASLAGYGSLLALPRAEADTKFKPKAVTFVKQNKDKNKLQKKSQPRSEIQDTSHK